MGRFPCKSQKCAKLGHKKEIVCANEERKKDNVDKKILLKKKNKGNIENVLDS